MKHCRGRLPSVTLSSLLLLAFVLGGGHRAAAQSMYLDLVDSQATGLLNPSQTFCLPIQKVAGVHQVPGTQTGQVSGGGFSFGNSSGTPIATRWAIVNGPTSTTLHIISQVTSSGSVVEKAVPIGSLYRACLTNTTHVLVSFSIQQSEIYLQ